MWSIKRKWESRIPIRWRLTIVSLGLLTLLLSVLGVFVLFAAEQELNNNDAAALRSEAHLALKSSRGYLFTLPSQPEPVGDLSPDLLQSATSLVQKLTRPRSDAAILSTDGDVLATGKDYPLAPAAVTLSPSLARQALTDTQQDDTYLLERDAQGNQQLIVLLPLAHDDHIVAILQIGTPNAPTTDFISALRLILLIGAVIALSIATALTIPLVGAALHPLVDMERTSRQIAEGDLSIRLEAMLANDEIGRLARSFNQMAAQLETTFQRQKRFVADASHELRTPLTALSGSLEMLLLGADHGDKEASGRLIRGMYAEVKRMHRLVEDLLALTRLDEGQLKLREDAVNIREILDKVYNQAQQLSHGQKIYCTSDTLYARADTDRLQQVLLNVVDNALKFTPVNGSIALLARPKEDERAVTIEIRDNGKGIPAENLPRVFDRFYRVDPSRSRLSKSPGGSGLGLAIAKELIEAQGGKISISSMPGEGTTVTIRLRSAV